MADGEEEPRVTAQPTNYVGVGRHYLRYTSATALVMLAGLISFPALTRLLDNTQYGILGYYETWVVMIFGIIKLGAPHAIQRLYPFGGDEAKLRHFATNLVLLPMLVSFALWLALVAVFAIVVGQGHVAHPDVLWFALLSMPLLVLSSQVQMTIRASERSRLLMVTRVVTRWLELALVLALVIAIQRSALAVYAGRVLTLLVMAVFFVYWLRRNLSFSRADLDFRAYRESLRYCLPLVVNEVAYVALVSIDRVMLKHLQNDFAVVGVYTIGYALAMQVNVVMGAPLWEAFNPVANRTHGLEGDAKVRALKARVLLPATYACVGMAVAIAAIGSDALQVLSGPDKAASGPVFAWIGAMLVLALLIDIAAYGLLLEMRSKTVLAITLLAVVVNVGLNLVLIPRYSYMGAVYATVVAYVVLSFGRLLACPRQYFALPDARTLFGSLGAAALFLSVLHFSGAMTLPSHWLRVLAAGGLWLLCYLLPVYAFDGRIRALARHWWSELRLGAAR